MATATVPAATFAQFALHASERKLRLFACACARSVWPLLTDERSRAAVEVAEQYADGEVAEEERLKHGLGVPVNGGPYSGTDIAVIAVWNNSSQTIEERLTAWLANTSTCPSDTILACVGGPWVACSECKVSLKNIEDRKRLDGRCSTCHGAGRVPAKVTLCGSKNDNGYCSFAGGAICRDECSVCCRILGFNYSCVQHLARHIYETRDFGLLPQLADALEEAGCTNAAILDHCRADGGECLECNGRGKLVPDGGMWTLYFNDKCKPCNGSGRLPAQHWRGCHVIDTILGRS